MSASLCPEGRADASLDVLRTTRDTSAVVVADEL